MSTLNVVTEKVKRITAEKLGLDEHQINPTTRFNQDLATDSLDFIDLIMALENEFRISIPDEIVERMNTVGDVIDFIGKQRVIIGPFAPV